MRVTTVKAKCKSCGLNFSAPLLSDFSYGEFVYSSQNAQRYQYLFAINNMTWDFVQSVLTVDFKIKAKDTGGIIQRVMGLIADGDGKVDFYQNEKVLCPSCGRDAKIQDRDSLTGFAEIDEMTFDRFERLTTEEKKKEIELIFE
jgi:hypothetical protein